MTSDAHEPERDDPLGGAFGASRAVRAGDFVLTSSLSGVTSLAEGEPQFGATFDEQLRVVGERVGRCLARFGCTTADIVEATVWLDPSVEIDPGLLLDRLQQDVFHENAPALSFVRAASMYPDALVSVKVVAYKPR